MNSNEKADASVSLNQSALTWSPSAAEVWWWAIPIATTIAILATYWLYPEFYIAHVLPEHTGILERSHFIMPVTGFLICLWLLASQRTKRIPYLRAAIVLCAIACFYIAGEEESWGQFFFGWETPDYWSEFNRQDETNLHNTSYAFNQFPQLILELTILIGGIIAPIVVQLRGHLINNDLIILLTPSGAMIPVSLGAVFFKAIDHFQKEDLIADILVRPSEAKETLYYMFILIFLIILLRRINRF